MSALREMLFWETHYRDLGLSRICGVDEAGRGPLAGPVVAAAVILCDGFDCDGIDDSKKLTAAMREQQYSRLAAGDCGIGVGIAEADCVDRINILQATYVAMRDALVSLEAMIDIVLVDGLPVPGLSRHRQHAIVGGDAGSASIAAASIIAKVTRDRIMVAYNEMYPQYGFGSHKGYGAPSHLDALRRHGPCPIHRKSFAPVAALLGADSAQGTLDSVMADAERCRA